MAFIDDKKLQKSVSKTVEETMSGLYWSDKKNIDKYKVSDFKIKDLNSTIKYHSKSKDFQVTSTYNYDYTCTTDIATSYVYKYSGSCKATLKITYSIDNGNLKIKNVKLSEKQKRK